MPDLRRRAEHGRRRPGGRPRQLHPGPAQALEDIADDDIAELEIPTGIPFRMLLDDDLAVRSADYLGDPEAAAAAAAAAVARQADQPTG